MHEGIPTKQERYSPPPLEEVKAAILSNEAYREHPFATNTEGKRTYVYELSDGARTLTYFGAQHTHDPENPEFDEIKETFDKANPDIVYLEGFGEYINNHKQEVRERGQEVTPEEAKERGEMFYTLKLAIDAGIDFESPELTRADEIRQLEASGFSRDDIFNFYFARSVDGYQRQAKELSREACLEYISRSLDNVRTASNWPKEEFDALEQKAIDGLQVQDLDTYKASVDPIPWEGKPQVITNDISRRLSQLRDEYGVERIAEGLKHYDRIFVVYGSAHAVRLEPALRMLFNAEEK